ncbi:MAG: hypothetical protein COB14_03670 [Alphaproteobacteria bacterium]|nr:MAG: hypothetical protein COB14_03670 [Alphaproteobacteria bacterium]
MIEETVWPHTFRLWEIVGFLGISFLAYAFWDYAMREEDKILLVSLSYFVPLVSTSLFIAFGILPANYYVAIDGALIVAGCVIVNIHHLKRLMKR